MTSKLFFFYFLVLSFEDHFNFLTFFLSKYLNIYRIKIFDLNTVKKRNAERHSNVSKSDSATQSLVNVSWLILQSFGGIFPTEY